MRRAALLLALLAPAPAQAATCPVERGAERFGAAVTTSGGERTVATRVVVCDFRTGSVRTIARARATTLQHTSSLERRARGRVLWDASAAGRRVAWVEGTSGRRRGTSRLVVADARTGRIRSRRVIWRHAPRTLPVLRVAVSAAGDLAWTGPPRAGDHLNRVIARPVGGPPRPVADDAERLAFEDRATLRLIDLDGRLTYHELRPPAQRGGCPVRTAFTPRLDAGGILVSDSFYLDPEASDHHGVVRVCVRGSGVDRVLAVDPDLTPLLVAGPNVLLAQVLRPRDGSEARASFALFDARDGRLLAASDAVDFGRPQAVALAGGIVTWTDPQAGPRSAALRPTPGPWPRAAPASG